MDKQVNKNHYEFRHYMDKARWASIWHQIDEVNRFSPDSVLEIGPGPGAFQSVAKVFGLHVKTLDIDPELKPDYLAQANAMPFEDNSFDVVCAFQMLEHVPYELSLCIFKEMCRVAKNGVVVSLPNARKIWPFSLYIPTIGSVFLHIPSPLSRAKKHEFDGQHHWELNKIGYAATKVISDFQTIGGKPLIKHFRVPDNPYHHFMVFS